MSLCLIQTLTLSACVFTEKVKQQEELLGKCRDNIQQNFARTANLTTEKEQLQRQLTASKVR